MKVDLPYGKGTIHADVPAKNLIGVYSPKDVRPVADVKKEVIRALANPIGSRPRRELVRGAGSVERIVADDNTRLTPTDRIIPVLLDEMNAAGVKDAQITATIALGTHRFMTQSEILEKFGADVVRRVAVRNHDYKNEAELIDLGTTPNGTHVTVNREAYEADFKIGVGSIVPHHIPGYAGGAEIVQPGICGEQTDSRDAPVERQRPALPIWESPSIRSRGDRLHRPKGGPQHHPQHGAESLW